MHVERVLVRAQALVARVPQQAVLGPFGELHLGHQLRLEPDDALARPRLRSLRERRVRPLEARERREELARFGRAQARTRPARVLQLAVLVMAQQKGAHPAHPLGRLRVAADDELLDVAALQLDPVAVARAAIGRVGALAHDALQVKLARRAQAVLAASGNMPAVADVGRRVGHQGLEHLLALGKGTVPQILAVQGQ